MRSKLKILLIAVLLAIAPLLMTAQTPPHPNNGTGPGAGNKAVGSQNGAPVGNGTIILFVLAVAYAGRKALSANITCTRTA